MAFRFFTNLRPQTIQSFAEVGYRPHGWLLSTHRADQSATRQARTLRGQGYDLLADNGTKPLIEDCVNAFDVDTDSLKRDIRALRKGLPGTRRIPRPSEVPTALRKRASNAAHAVCDRVDEMLNTSTVQELTAAQLNYHGNLLIAKEDFAIACLLALGLEREITGWPVAYFDRRNEISLSYYVATLDQLDSGRETVYLTLSALDYATARSAARLAAKQGIQHIAFGFAGVNSDRTFTEVYAMPWRTHLEGSAPRQYVRSVEILSGIRDGYAECGVKLESFHGLGLGATAAFPLVAAILCDVPNLSVDATSPIHDAVNDLVYYDEKKHGDRLTAMEAATRVVEGEGWLFQSPVMAACREVLTFDPEQAIAWWDSVNQRSIEKQDLLPTTPLGQALLVFANGSGSTTTRQRLHRIAHNHWVCDHLAARTPNVRARSWALDQIDRLIETRSRSTRWGLMAAKVIIEKTGNTVPMEEENTMTTTMGLWRHAMAIRSIVLQSLKALDGSDQSEEMMANHLAQWHRECERAAVYGGRPLDHEMLSTARSRASVLHCRFHLNYLSDSPGESDAAYADIFQQLRWYEDRYVELVSLARVATIEGGYEVIRALNPPLEELATGVAGLCGQAGALSHSVRNNGCVGIRVSHLGRRIAMMAAAMVYLEWRMLDGRSANGVQKVARNRVQLMRNQLHEESVERFISTQAEGDRLTVTARISDTDWVDRPEIPYSFARLHHTNFEFRVHRRDMMALGVSPGRYFWARGKYELSDDVPVVISEFEGIDQHAGTYWEDFLGAEIRAAYDLHPSSIDMIWEFPHSRFRSGMNDFLARTRNPIQPGEPS